MKLKTYKNIAIATALIGLCQGAHAAVSNTGLVGYYSFDSDTADDTSATLGGSASSNSGAWTGSSNYGAGLFGNAATVSDGAGSNFLTVSGSEYNFGTNSFTVILWARLASSATTTQSDPPLVASGGRNWSSSGTAPAGYNLDYTSGDNIGATLSGGSGATRTDVAHIDIDYTDWSMIALSVDRDTDIATVYALDELVTTIGDDSSAPTSNSLAAGASLTLNNDIVFGQDGDGAGYTSLPATGIDDVSIRNGNKSLFSRSNTCTSKPYFFNSSCNTSKVYKIANFKSNF